MNVAIAFVLLFQVAIFTLTIWLLGTVDRVLAEIRRQIERVDTGLREERENLEARRSLIEQWTTILGMLRGGGV